MLPAGLSPAFSGNAEHGPRGRDTGDSQFFLTFVPTPHLNGRHTAFGRVIEGMDVLANLQRRSTQHQPHRRNPTEFSRPKWSAIAGTNTNSRSCPNSKPVALSRCIPTHLAVESVPADSPWRDLLGVSRVRPCADLLSRLAA